jgi:hypothetical protein
MHSRPLVRWLTLASPLALLVACSGSGTLDESALAEDPAADSLSSPELLDAATRVPASLLGETDLKSVALQIPGRDLALHPPKVVSAEVVPADGDEEATLEVTFGEALPDVLKTVVDGKVAELRDDGREADRASGDGVYTTRVPAEWRRTFGTGRATSELADFLQPPAITTRSGTLPDFSLSLLITNLAVVNDTGRVSDPCLNFVTPSITAQEWSFGYMLNHMANTAMTGVSADAFARAWLSGWMNPTTINGDSVTPPVILPPELDWDSPNNVSVARYIFNTWRLASRVRSDGTLDPNTNPPLKMEKAPFRLLGIAFRPDLRKNSFFGEGSAGELRFIYGVLDLDQHKELARDPRSAGWGTQCEALDGPAHNGDFNNSTVILEYAVDRATGDIINWGKAVSNLSNLGPHTRSTYRTELQRLTDSVVRASLGRANRRANESALIRIRTNEAVGGGGPWNLREFGITAARDSGGNLRYQNGKLVCTVGSTQYCVPKPQTVKQTPADSWNASKTLSSYAFQNEAAILAETHNVPEVFNSNSGPVRLLGGKAIIRQAGGTTFWEMPLVDSDVRHKLSLNTCNGCHSAETNTSFAHVQSRNWDQPAQLSAFLSGYFVTGDPVTGEPREFSEPERRAVDLKALADGQILTMLSFQPTSRTH